MKWFFTGLCGLFLFDNVEAVSLHISKVNLGVPFYRSIASLKLMTNESETGNVSVKFYGKNNLLLESKENIRIKKTDYESCRSDICTVEFFELPPSLEKHSCLIEVKFQSSAGQIYLHSKENWGDCIVNLPIPDRKYLSDLVFPENSNFSDQAEIEIQNIGSNLFQKPLEVWGFLKNKENEIIWSGEYKSISSILSQEQYSIKFPNPPKAWQNHLACYGTFYISPGFDFFERSKINNKIDIEYGDCDEIPSETSGDRIDFKPVIEFPQGLISLKAVNNGRLAYLEPTTRLESYIRYFNSQKEVLLVKNLFTDAPIYGFGDAKNIYVESLPLETCFIEIELNPNLTIKENNYTNNRIELNICE